MFKVNYEFRKGILFIRLSGNINQKNMNKTVDDINSLINNVGFKKIVVNIDKINSIDVCCIKNMLYNINNLSEKGISLVICNKDNNFNTKLPVIKKETEAYNMI